MIEMSGCDCESTIKSIQIMIGIIIILIILFFRIFYRISKDIERLEIQLQAQTPESRELAHTYFKILFEEHKKNRDYDKRLDKMFEDERSE